MVISDKDWNLISHYIECYGLQGHSNAYRSRETNRDVILAPWFEAKSEYLLPMFKNQLILEREVEYSTPDSQLISSFEQAVYRDNNNPLSKFEKIYSKWIRDTYGVFTSEADALYALLDSRFLAMNHLGDYINTKVIPLDENNLIKIQPNVKPMKLLAKIAKHINAEREFEEARLEHSRLLNQKKLKGTLCLSIHPLDFMTMSDNGNRWSSCMNWTNAGDYRQGTVEMMNSPMVVVGYLRDANDMCLTDCCYDEYWNSKKWRSLFIVNEHLITSVKDYPFYCPELLKTCTEWLRELANDYWTQFNFPHPTQEILIEQTFDYVDGEPYNISPSTDYASMYNDFCCTKAHFGSLSTRQKPIDSFLNAHKIHFNYAGLSECMWCGDTNCDLYEDSYVVCTECCSNGYVTYCDCCGAEIYDEDDVYWHNDVPMCSDCYYDNTEECSISGDRYDPEDLTTVYLVRNLQGEECVSEESPAIRIYNGYIDCRPYNSNFNCSPRYDGDMGLYFWFETDINHPEWYFPI